MVWTKKLELGPIKRGVLVWIKVNQGSDFVKYENFLGIFFDQIQEIKASCHHNR